MQQFSTLNTELRAAVTKMRDQLRMEQFACENLRLVSKRLGDELEASREELCRRNALEDEALLVHASQVETLKSSLEKQNKMLEDDSRKHKVVVSKLHAMVAAANAEGLALHETFDIERASLAQQRASQSLLDVFYRLKQRKMALAFRQWSTTALLVAAAGQFRANLETVVEQTIVNSQLKENAAVEQTLAQALEEREMALERQRMEHTSDIIRLKALLEAEKGSALDALKAEHEGDRRRLGCAHNEALAEQRVEDQKLLEIALSERDAETRLMVLEFEDELKTTKEEFQVTLDTAKEEVKRDKDVEYEGKMKLLRSELDAREENAIRDLACQHEAKVVVLEEKKLEELALLRSHLEHENRAGLEALSIKWHLEVQKHSAEWEVVIQERLQEAEVLFGEKLAVALKEKDAAFESVLANQEENLRDETYDRLNEQEKEWRLKFMQQEEVLIKSLELEKQRAVALEASKWQVAMKEAETIFQIEGDRLRREGWNERDLLAKKELLPKHEITAEQLKEIEEKV